LLFAVDEGVDVVGGEFEAVAVDDGVGGAGFNADKRGRRFVELFQQGCRWKLV
jgi:hypothetical protein